MSIPPKKQGNTEFERVKVDEFINGEIEEVQEDPDHHFKGGMGKDGQAYADRQEPAVRFKFKLEGYEHSKYSRWMLFSYNAKATLFIKYITPLVKGAYEYMMWDIQELKGMKVKITWGEKKYGETNVFQFVETIIPADKKIEPNIDQPKETSHPQEGDEAVPF